MKRLFSFLLCLTMVFSLAVPASAAGGSVSFQYGSGAAFKVTPGDENYTATDLFGSEFKNIMPGDEIDQTITIKNNSYKYDYIKVYMKAVPHTKESDLTYDRAQAKADGKRDDETVESMTKFLQQLNMTVTVNGSKEIFDDSPDEAGDLASYVRLATLNRFKKVELNVHLEWPIEGDHNAFMDRVGEVDWVFYVEGFNNPEDSNPTTGDMIMTAVAVMAVSAAAIVLLLVIAKKKKKK